MGTARVQKMFDPKRRVIAWFLGLVLLFAVGACGDDDSPTTTSPGSETTTTEGVGS